MLLVAVMFTFLAIGAGLTWYLLARDQGKKEPVAALWIVVGFGLLGMIVAAYLEAKLLPAKDLSLVVRAPLPDIFMATLGVGLIEEGLKFIPAALFLYKKPYFRNHVDGVIFFAITGLAFGIPENILYAAHFGAKVGLVRIFMDPVFHATTTGMVGYFLGKAKVEGKPLYATGVAFVGAILLHAVYDFGLFSGNLFLIMVSVCISAAMAAVLFILFSRAKELDRQAGLVVVGHNNFCRSCGNPNPTHSMFCTKCGARA